MPERMEANPRDARARGGGLQDASPEASRSGPPIPCDTPSSCRCCGTAATAASICRNLRPEADRRELTSSGACRGPIDVNAVLTPTYDRQMGIRPASHSEMPTGIAEVAYRPVRIGSSIRAGSCDDLLAALGLNTALWGGAFNPVFEVYRSERKTEESLRELPVDALHPIVERAALRRVVERHDALRWPRYGSLIRESEYQARLAAVDVTAAIRSLRAARLDNPPKTHFCIPRWSESDPFAMVFAATFGDIAGAEDFLPGIERALADATGASDVDAAAAAAAARHHDFPIDVTRTRLRRGPGRGFTYERWDGVFVGDATSVADVCSYWNLRSQGVDALFWDKETGGPFVDAVARDVAGAPPEDSNEEGPSPERWYPCYLASVPPERDQ